MMSFVVISYHLQCFALKCTGTSRAMVIGTRNGEELRVFRRYKDNLSRGLDHENTFRGWKSCE